MKDIGVRQLKTKASEIIRSVRERRQRYVVTHRGRPVAMLSPLERPTQITPSALQDNNDAAWEELVRLGDQIAESWKSEQTSVELISESRR